MPFNLTTGETALLDLEIRRGRISVTTHRLVLTYSESGSSGVKYLPLEKIDSMEETKTRKPFTRSWLIAIIIGLICLVIPGIVLFIIWYFGREDGIVFRTPTDRIVLGTGLLRGGIPEGLMDAVETARKACIREVRSPNPVRVALTD